MKKIISAAVVTITCLLAILSANAQPVIFGLGSSNTELTVAIVESFEPVRQSVRLRHEEIKNLDIGPGVTRFRTENASLFSKLHPGQRVAFRAVKSEGQYVIVAVEPR